MEPVLKLIDVIFLSRPLLLVPVWGFCIFGYYHGTSSLGKTAFSSIWTMHSQYVFLWFVIFSFSVASIYILNQLSDINVDKANKGLPLLAKGKVSVNTAWRSACVCALIGVAAPLFKHPFLSVCAATALIAGSFYSFNPIRLSGRFCLDFLTNAAGYGIIAFGVGWHLSGALLTVSLFAVSALPYFLLMCAGSISSTIPDYHGDKQYGKNTTAVFLGVLKAHVLATFFLCLAIIAALTTKNYIALTCALCAFPLYIAYFFNRNASVQEATYKVGGVACMGLAAFLMPVFAVAAIIVAALTSMYFKKRYQVTYPSLVPKSYEK